MVPKGGEGSVYLLVYVPITLQWPRVYFHKLLRGVDGFLIVSLAQCSLAGEGAKFVPAAAVLSCAVSFKGMATKTTGFGLMRQ